jgi:hypothetical protein
MEKLSRYALGLVFLGLGSALLDLALRRNGLAHAASLSGGICFALLSFAYFFSWPRLLGKRRDGKLLISSYALFWPYHLSNYVLLAASRLLLRERPFDEIAPGLFIGARLLPFDRAKATACDFRSVLDLTCEFSETSRLREAAVYFCIPLLDRGTPSQPQLRAGLDFIRKRLEVGPVYVHCAQGHGRSATFAAAWLLATGCVRHPREAVQMLQSKRPLVRLTVGQFSALTEFSVNLEKTDARRNL